MRTSRRPKGGGTNATTHTALSPFPSKFDKREETAYYKIIESLPMTLISTSALRKITFVVLTVALLTFGATEIHKLLIIPRQQQQAAIPTQVPAKDWNAPPEGLKEPLPGSHYYPSDEEIVEGVVTDSRTGSITLKVNGQPLTFYTQVGYFLAAPENGGEITPLVVVGRRMRIYYEERDGKLYIVFGEYLGDEETL